MQQADTNGSGIPDTGLLLSNLASIKAERFQVCNSEAEIPAGQNAEALLNDVSCLLGAAHGVLEDLAMGGDSDGEKLWAAVYLVRMARSMTNSIVLSRPTHCADGDAE